MKTYTILLVAILAFISLQSYAQAPVPFVNLPLMPDATAPGGGDFTLTVNGTGFVSNSVVNWNGIALATQFVSSSQLTATVPAADIATAGTGWVTVVNPAPGGGTSNVAFFTVTANAGKRIGFTLASSTTVSSWIVSEAVGDFNGDGKLDLAILNEVNTISILLGDGGGNFSQVSTASGAGAADNTSIAVGDFNGDGKLDLAFVNECYDNTSCTNGTVSILLGDGTGNFTMASYQLVGLRPTALAVGDFNEDGKLDVAVVNCGEFCFQGGGNGSVSVLLGDGTGNLTLASSPATGIEPVSVAVGDFNGDGRLDLAVVNKQDIECCYSGTVSILLGDGTGNFSLGASVATNDFPQGVAVGDFNEDGNLDLAVGTRGDGYNPGPIAILLGDGAGNFTPGNPVTAGVQPSYLAVGDFNGDGQLDLAAANDCGPGDCWSNPPGSVSVFLGDGAGNFTTLFPVLVDSFPRGMAVGDVNGDGKLDMLVPSEEGFLDVVMQGAPYPVATFSKTSLVFGTQFVGTASPPQVITLTNTGTATLRFASVMTGGAARANFSEGNNCGRDLKVGAGCTIRVTFAPLEIGTLSGAIIIADNASNSPQEISLTGVGRAVTLLPRNIDFGNQPVGTTSEPQIVTLTNYADRTLTIHGIRITGDAGSAYAQTNTCGTSVPAGGSCTISVTFTPWGRVHHPAVLEVGDNGGASPQTVRLTGMGI